MSADCRRKTQREIEALVTRIKFLEMKPGRKVRPGFYLFFNGFSLQIPRKRLILV